MHKESKTYPNKSSNLSNNKLSKTNYITLLFLLSIIFLSKSQAKSDYLEWQALYDSERLYINIQKPITYRIFYPSKHEINIFLPFDKIENKEFNYSLYSLQAINWNFYSVLRINTPYPLPFELIDVTQDEDKLTISLPLEYKVRTTTYFYSSDNRLIAKLYYQISVDDFLQKKKGISSYGIQISDFSLFNINFICNDKREELNFNKTGFWFAINGTYFARSGNRYRTVAGVVYDNQIVSYPVEWRPPRGFWAILKKDQQSSFLFDRLPNLKKDFENFISYLRNQGYIHFLIQAGPLIYKDHLLMMDIEAEAFGLKGNNIIDDAPRTVIYVDRKNRLNFEVIYGLQGTRKDGLNIYELVNYLSETKDALNLDGGSSSCIYISNKKLEPLFEKNFPYNSQNYIVFYTNTDFYVVSEKSMYYYFPGIFGLDHNNIVKIHGANYVTIFNGYEKYQKVFFSDEMDYYHNTSKKMIFIQTNDLQMSLEKLNLEKIKNINRYYNCYIIEYE